MDDQLLLRILSSKEEGMTAQEILKALGSSTASMRSLQRHLASLVKDEAIYSKGHTKGKRYFAATVGSTETIPLSKQGLQILSFVRGPIAGRPLALYERDWLDRYRPNHTYYLPLPIREELKRLGSSNLELTFAGTFAKQIYTDLLVDLSWNSSRLEGNTYSFLETKHLLEGGELPKEKSLTDTQMILNHKQAIEFLIESAEQIGIEKFTILNLHALLSDNLLPNSASCGRLRTIAVAIGKSTYKPLDIPQLIEECFDQILKKASAILDPFEQAFFLMVHLPYLQPFEDVNKRVSRLSANIPLICHNLCPLTFVGVPEDLYISALLGVYELRRVDLLVDLFVFAYQQSSLRYQKTKAVLGQADPFRLRHREAIAEIIYHIVAQNIKEVTPMIRQYANLNLAKEEEQKFVQVVEEELLGLHEGNIARYQLTQNDFRKWCE